MSDRQSDYLPDAVHHAATPSTPPTQIPRRANRRAEPVVSDDDALIAGGAVVSDTNAPQTAETNETEEPVVTAKIVGGPKTAKQETDSADETEKSEPAAPETNSESAAEADTATAATQQESESPVTSEPQENSETPEVSGRIPVTGPIPVVAKAAPDANTENQPAQAETSAADEPTTAEIATVTDAHEAAATLAQRRSLLNAPAAPANTDLPDADWSKPSAPTQQGNTALHQTAATPTPQQLEAVMFEGATLSPVIPKRVGGRIWSLLLTLLLLPLAWLLLAKYAQLTWAYGLPLNLSAFAENTKILIYFLTGGVAALLVVLIARLSSLGAFVSGIIWTVVGFVALIAPQLLEKLSTDYAAQLLISPNLLRKRCGQVLELALNSAHAGVFLLIGLALLMLGFVAYGARRSGRRDMNTRSIVETDKEVEKKA